MDRAASYKQEIPFVRILVPFGSGIMSFYNCRTDWLIPQLTLISFFLFSYLLLHKNNHTKNRRDRGAKGIAIHLMFFFSGSLCSTLHNNQNHSDYYLYNKKNYLKIRINDEPKIRQNIILFSALITKSINSTYCKSKDYKTKYNFQPTSGKISVTIIKKPSIPMNLRYGDELIIPSKFIKTPPPSNAWEFDLKSWLATKNIYQQVILEQKDLVKLNSNSGNKLISFALHLREKQVRVYRSLIKNDNAFVVATTLILGYRADLSNEILNTYSKTGTIHVLSVSGMHVGLIYLILNHALCFLNRRSVYKIIKTSLIILAIWFYAMLTGFSPAALRATIMLTAFIIAKVSDKYANSYNILAFTAFCILIYDPFLIWDIGFQLSFTAVLGLLYLQPKIQQWLPLTQPWLAKLWSIVAMSLAAQLATYPFSVYYFHQFPVYFLISNLFITIPGTLIMYIGIIILLFRLDGLAPAFEWLLNFTNAGLDQIAKWPFSTISSIWLTKVELFLLCLSLLLFILACIKFYKPLFIYSSLIFLTFQCFISFGKLSALHQRKIIRFAVGKNYAYAIISGKSALLFTNLEPRHKAFKYKIKPALDQHRITRITFRNPNITGF